MILDLTNPGVLFITAAVLIVAWFLIYCAGADSSSEGFNVPAILLLVGLIAVCGIALVKIVILAL